MNKGCPINVFDDYFMLYYSRILRYDLPVGFRLYWPKILKYNVYFQDKPTLLFHSGQ